MQDIYKKRVMDVLMQNASSIMKTIESIETKLLFLAPELQSLKYKISLSPKLFSKTLFSSQFLTSNCIL